MNRRLRRAFSAPLCGVKLGGRGGWQGEQNTHMHLFATLQQWRRLHEFLCVRQVEVTRSLTHRVSLEMENKTPFLSMYTCKSSEKEAAFMCIMLGDLPGHS